MSSLFAALGVAVSGLNAQSQSIGNISDNLSNTETTGYKSIGTSFSDLVTASSATANSPGGVSATPQYQNDVQGNIAATSTTTNLAISGQGYFEVTSATQDSTGNTVFSGNNYYTRQGDFTLNKDGYMVNSSGYYLEGYSIDASGTVDTAQTTEVQISSLLDNPVATASITYAANLPASAASGYNSTASTVNVYDALGNTHQVSVTWSKESTANTWLADITVAGGAGGSDYHTQATVVFNDGTGTGSAGTIASITPVTAGAVTATANTVAGTVTIAGTAGLPQTITINATPTSGSATDYTFTTQAGESVSTMASDMEATLASAGYTVSVAGGVITISGGGTLNSASITSSAANGYVVTTANTGSTGTSAGLNLNLDYTGAGSDTVDFNMGTLNAATGVTQYANSSTTVSVSTISQDGLGEGSYSSIGIDTNGVVSINYTNGSTRKIYQIPIAQFNSPDNLQRSSGGVYTATLASGTANLHLAGTNGSGTVSSSSLESSDVDIATEFTTMIQSQQAYSANAKVVTTVNSMLNTIIQAVQ